MTEDDSGVGKIPEQPAEDKHSSAPEKQEGASDSTRAAPMPEELVSRKYRYRLYPSKQQLELLEQITETQRRLWNHLNGVVMDALSKDVSPRLKKDEVAARAKELGRPEKEIALEDGGRWRKEALSALKARGWTDAGLREEFRRQTRELRKSNPFVGKVAFAVLDAVVMSLVKSWGAYRVAVRGAKMPRFKKRGETVGIAAPSRNIFWLRGDRVQISSVELDGKRCDLRFVKHRELPSIPKSATITKDGSYWYVTFGVERRRELPGTHKGPAVGIDRGVRSAIADSTGRTVPGFVEDPARLRKKLRLERSVARKKRGSSNWFKAQAKLHKHMQKTTRRRDDFLHKESIRYARQYGTVVVERLAIQNMTRSAKGTAEEPGTNVRAKAGLNRSILAQGWGRFVQYLQYKCDERGGVVLDVEPRNTSRTCSSCGTVDAESRDGKDFNCTSCGHSEDADVNAARVVLALGLRGEVAAPKKPKKKLHSVVGKRRKAKEPTTADAGAGQDPERPVEDQRDSAPEKQESSGTSTQKPRRKRPSKTRAEAAE